MIGILNYKAGNTRSVENALKSIDVSFLISNKPEELNACDQLIIPGVGMAKTAMEDLKNTGLDQFIISFKKPVLGICLGMQLLANYSEEGNIKLLSRCDYQVQKFKGNLPIPHMGWNAIECHGESPLLSRTEDGTYFYFVHSYAAHPADPGHVAASARYGGETIVAAVARENVFGTQFHPEKSQGAGIRLLRDFVSRIAEATGSPRDL